ncbi:MAG: hypothetical protein KUG71_08310 [Porticoccaceae bacterium]|nr:hypothetical protein [Porticoccaceae bacterium]
MNLRRGLGRLSRYLTATAVVVLIGYAVIVVIGRQALPYLNRYQPQINHFFSQQLGIELSTEHINGVWTGLSPRIELRGLRLGNGVEGEVFYVQRLSAELDLLRSVAAGELIWHQLSLGAINIVLREAADGHWSVEGLPPLAGNDDEDNQQQLSQIVERLLLNRFIGVEKVSAELAFYSGTRAAVNFDNIKLESEGDFHRLTAGFAFDDNPSSAQLVIEGRGDVVSPEAFKGSAYLRLNRINFSGSLSAIVARWFPQLVARMGDIESELATEIWLESGPDGGVNLIGQLQADEIPLSWAADLAPIKNLRAQLSGWFQPGEDWGLRWQGLDFDWMDVDIQPLDFSFSQRVGARWGELSLAASQINLATLSEVLRTTGLATGMTETVVSTLSAKGHLKNLHLDLDLDKAFPLQALRTRIDHLELKSWLGAPATRGLSGYLHWQDSQGFFDIDSPDGFAMHYPGVYDGFMEHGSSRGRVSIQWQPEDAALKIAGGPISIDDDQEGQIRAYLSLDIPLKKGGIPEMYLLAGIRNSHSRYADQYIPSALNPALLAWLDRAVGDMDVSEAGFIWRGSLLHRGSAGRSIQFYAKVENGQVDYDPAWPRLSDMSAYITVDGARLNGLINSAELGDSGKVHLDRAVVKTHPDALLSVLAEVSTSLPEAANILLASPLKERVAMLESWQLEGQSQVQLDLMIPLGEQRENEHYRVDTNIKKGQMSHKDVDVEFEGISGLISYSDGKGLYSPGVQARLWGQKIDGSIATTEGATRIASQGQFDMALLPAWNSLLKDNVRGVSDYDVSFVIPEAGNPYLAFNSTLQGITSDFPRPLNKASVQPLALEASVSFADNLLVKTRLGERLGSSFKIDKGEIVSGHIALGTGLTLGDTEPSAEPGLSIVGTTPILDLDAWLAVFETPEQSPEGSEGSEGLEALEGSDVKAPPKGINLSALKPDFSVHLGELIYRGILASSVDATGRYDSEGLDVYLDSEILAGQINIPTNKNQALVMDLNYLTLPEPDLDSDESFLDQLDPTGFPHLNFSTEGLRVGQEELGSLAFVMRPLADGVELSNINAEITGIGISNLPDGESSVLSWRLVNGEHQSRLSGLLKTYDLGAVLRAWQLPVVLNSEEAISIVDLHWQAKPWEFSINKLRGQTALNFKDGNFFRAPGTTSNAFIKMIGLINFHTWARRLRLDFSDLFASGVSYETLKGGLQFSEGTVAFDAPIVVDLPSGKMRLMGQADLLAETVDSRLVATLPVGTNLPWIAALAGGLPAAAGVYITGKLFEKQVDRVSSFSYKVTGPWAEPEVQIDRIFSDKTDG